MTLVVLLLASPSQAQIPDPVETGLLQRIAAALQAIETFRMKVLDQIQVKIYNRLRSYAFPSPLFNPITHHDRQRRRHPKGAAAPLLQLAVDEPADPRPPRRAAEAHDVLPFRVP